MKKHLVRIAGLALVASIDAAPAFAQGLDVQNGTNTVVALILALFGVIALGIAAWQGLEAMQNHRAIMPAFISLVIGLGLIFGGAYYLQKFGVNAGGIGAVGI